MKVSEVNKILKDKNKQDMETNFKLKTAKQTGGPGNTRKPPKYFTDFANEMRLFVQEQRKNWEEQRKFNKFVLDMFNKHKWIK